MTTDQGLTFALLAATIAAFIWGRVRYDLVAVCALLGGVVLGVVPMKEAFRGFSDDIVIIVGSALIVSAAIGRSGVVETIAQPLGKHLTRPQLQVPALVALVTVMSALIKNIGAVAILMPIALQMSRLHGVAPSVLLMPIAFGSLLGGLITLIGTSPNIIVSRLRAELVGQPFAMFDFAPVGGALAMIGLAFLAVGWRLLPGGRTPPAAAETKFRIDDYTTEAVVPARSPFVNKTVEALERAGDGAVSVIAVIREKRHRYIPAGHWWLYPGDILILEGDAAALKNLIDQARLEPGTPGGRHVEDAHEDFVRAEAVVTERSTMIGATVGQLGLRDRLGLTLLALSRRGHRVRERLNEVRFQPGDLLVLHGRAEAMAETLATLGCLPLAERNLQLGRRRRMLPPLLILAVAIALVVFEIAPVTVAFFGAAVLILLARGLTLKDAYQHVEWPILVLLGALIPVSEALQRTGASGLIADALSQTASHLPPIGALAMMLAVAMLVTPFLNNAATVLVMAPIGAGLASRLGLSPDPFLMAVAVGAGCDFLTPIGHQCNTLVMGPGGYRFGDYARLGAPLSLLILIAAPFLIAMVWPLDPSR